MRSAHPIASRRNRATALLATGACLLAAAVGPAGAAAASTHTPAKATHVALAAATSSSLTVRTARARYARKYLLYVSSTKSDLYYDKLTHNRHSRWRHWAIASGPRITVRGLHYTTKPYWFRVRTINGRKSAYSSTIRSAGVRPGTPTSLRVRNVGGLSLTWSSGGVTGFVIKQATNASMTRNVRWWRIAGSTHQFTPYGIKPGTHYWFGVRGVNNATMGHYSNHAAGTTGAHEKNLRIMTYNVLMTQRDGQRMGSGTAAPWAKRVVGATALIKHASPDVLAVQEAGGWIGPNPGSRQVDTLLYHLGSGYGLAHTEVTWNERYTTGGYKRVYSYIIYKKSTMRTVSSGGHFALDPSSVADQHWAAYQQLRSIRTGATFLMVSTHLIAGHGAALDTRRGRETNVLVANTRRIANSLGVPAVYGGDFNSNPDPKSYHHDGPGSVMRAAHAVDARLVAQKHYNGWSSLNFLERTPHRYPIHAIDYVFASPGTSVYSWAVSVRLSRGRFVGTMPSDHNPVWSTVVVRY